MIITTINEVNSSVFERLMPERLFSALTMPGYFALGAIWEEEGEKYAAGTLVFEVTEGFNGADITEFCEKLKMEAINKSLVENTEHIITMNDVIEVSKKIKSSVLNDDIEQLKNFENKF